MEALGQKQYYSMRKIMVGSKNFLGNSSPQGALFLKESSSYPSSSAFVCVLEQYSLQVDKGYGFDECGNKCWNSRHIGHRCCVIILFSDVVIIGLLDEIHHSIQHQVWKMPSNYWNQGGQTAPTNDASLQCCCSATTADVSSTTI